MRHYNAYICLFNTLLKFCFQLRLYLILKDFNHVSYISYIIVDYGIVPDYRRLEVPAMIKSGRSLSWPRYWTLLSVWQFAYRTKQYCLKPNLKQRWSSNWVVSFDAVDLNRLGFRDMCSLEEVADAYPLLDVVDHDKRKKLVNFQFCSFAHSMTKMMKNEFIFRDDNCLLVTSSNLHLVGDVSG